ncbi:MAG TPA: sulfatase [Candidatus Paceibacterota bacterium]|nr:sulfatase [Verrucomicrobiota bacterium]HRZ45918.1 sulfatase [Candidatus Paceibacterota bacterium]HRZ94239.1 sulfatase [Candidatus Paceibacterota bacterium]
MNISLRLAAAFLAGAALTAAAGSPSSSGPAMSPNVLFIAVDDLNHWVGYLGRNPQTLTPHMDRLARRGVWFTRSYCAAPVCNPSRAALMSGLRPGSTGVYDNQENFAPVIPEAITLTTQFRKAGYYVCGAGKIYHSSVYRPGEWDDWFRSARGAGREEDGAPETQVQAGKLPITPLNCGDDDMPDARFVRYAIEQLNRKHDRPFFIACGLTKPHLPWSVPKQYYERFPIEQIELPPCREDDLEDLPPIALRFALSSGDHAAILAQGGTNTWKQAIRAYLATISFCDTMVGRLLDAYDRSPERDRTILCFWSDHGWHLGEKQHWRKFALWEESTRAPFIWIVPGLTPADGRCDRTVDFMSIYPTLMDLCGIPTPAHVQGRSLRTLLANPKAPWDAPAITTYRQNNHSIRTELWRYTRYADGGQELYDETADPYEWVNLARKEGASAPTIQRLSSWLPAENKPPAPSSPNPAARPRRANRP